MGIHLGMHFEQVNYAPCAHISMHILGALYIHCYGHSLKYHGTGKIELINCTSCA